LHCEAQLDKKCSYRESHIRRRNRLENPTNPRKYPVHGILRCKSRQCRAAVATKLLEKAQTIEQRFPTNAVKLAQAQAIQQDFRQNCFQMILLGQRFVIGIEML